MAQHSTWRDCQAWRDEGLPMSTTSNEAAKLYDAALTQYVSWREDDSAGGLEATCDKMIQADPNFVMGHVLLNGLDLMGTGRSVTLDPTFKEAIDTLVAMAAKSTLSDRERKHVKAVATWAEGHTLDATLLWEDILLEHPSDMLAIKFAHDAYFYLGQQRSMRDSIVRVMPQWKPTAPLYNYLFGMKAFGLVETNLYTEAEAAARHALSLNRRDAWATHALAHVLEVGGRADEGLAFLSSTVQDWEPCGMLACHNFWHWAVYHIEKGEHQGALDLYDSEISKRMKSGAMLDIVDATSLLYRLGLEDVSVGDRWVDVAALCRPHVDDHILAFNDVHLLMSCLGSQQIDAKHHFMMSLKEFVRTGSGVNRGVTADVGLALCEALVAFEDGDFAKATDLLVPCRYDIIRIGGSDAQRDLFNQFLIHSSMKSSEKQHKRLARSLLYERKALKENSPLTDRLMARALAAHAY